MSTEFEWICDGCEKRVRADRTLPTVKQLPSGWISCWLTFHDSSTDAPGKHVVDVCPECFAPYTTKNDRLVRPTSQVSPEGFFRKFFGRTRT